MTEYTEIINLISNLLERYGVLGLGIAITAAGVLSVKSLLKRLDGYFENLRTNPDLGTHLKNLEERLDKSNAFLADIAETTHSSAKRVEDVWDRVSR